MKKFLVYATLLAALPLAAQVVTSPANDQGPLTRQQGEQILQELRQIRQLLERQQAKPAAPQEEAAIKAKLTDLSGVPMLGSKSAPLTIEEYTDYQCPFCQRFHVTAFPELKKAYLDPGRCASSARTCRSISIPTPCAQPWPPAAPVNRASSGNCAIPWAPTRIRSISSTSWDSPPP